MNAEPPPPPSGKPSAGPSSKISPFGWVAALFLFCAVAIALQAWDFRFSIRADGISYLDMADAALKGNFAELAHPYWSPLYPTLLASALKILSPAPPAEVLVVHLVNGLLGLFSLTTFTFFVRQWSRMRISAPEESMLDFRLRTAFAYSFFLWATIEMIGLERVTPDLCVAGLVYLIAGLCCKLDDPGGNTATSVFLGIVLGLAYYAKSPMLPLGFALLVLLAIPRLRVLRRRLPLAIAALIFVMATGPFLLALSRHEHRLTFGESGRLNYAWLIVRNVPQYAGWTGNTPYAGAPIHPPRVLMVQPTVIEFKNMAPGTYPLWYNPAFFYEGLKVHFELRKQLRELSHSPEAFFVAHGSVTAPLLAGLGVLFALVVRRRFSFAPSLSWLILWSLVAFSMFALVTIESRYIAPFAVLFWIAVYDCVSPGEHESSRAVYRAVMGVVTVCILLFLAPLIGVSAAHLPRKSGTPVDAVVATELTRLGLQPGDEIATMGYPFYVYYARVAHLRVIANIGFRGGNEEYDTDQFWKLSDSKMDALKEQLRRIGAKAIVSPDSCPVSSSDSTWHVIGNTGYCVQLLN